MCATMFKNFLANDIAQTRTLLNESIPITGSLFSASYGTHPNEQNIKNFAHGMWSSVYDYPYLSSSANQIMDITVGYANSSGCSSSTAIQNDKKINIYTQYAQTLMGFDQTGSVQLFDEDGDILAGGTKIKEAIFINFSRLLTKDEIKKGSFSMTVCTGANTALLGLSRITLGDVGAANDYKVNSPVGEYGILTCSTWTDPVSPTDGPAGKQSLKCGLIFYQAGVVVLTAALFAGKQAYYNPAVSSPGLSETDVVMLSPYMGSIANGTLLHALTAAFITSSADAIRRRIYNIQFSNTTELNSTIYFCRADAGDFNYSANPSYLSGSQIRVKQNSTDMPCAYITTIGLYSSDNELLGVAKLSECIRKTPDTSLTFRVRMDY